MPEFASRGQLSGNKWQQEWARQKRSSDYDVALDTTTQSSSCFFSNRHTHLQENSRWLYRFEIHWRCRQPTPAPRGLHPPNKRQWNHERVSRRPHFTLLTPHFSALATERFFRSADRRGAGPRRAAVLGRRSSARLMRWEHAVQFPVAAMLTPSHPPTPP